MASKDLFAEVQWLREYMDERRRRLLDIPGQPQFCLPVLRPLVDIYETGEDVVVVVEMPGINIEALEVTVSGRQLTVAGQKEDLGSRRPGRLYSQMEINCGSFERTVALPTEVDADKAEASYQQGFLEIVFPKSKKEIAQIVRIIVK